MHFLIKEISILIINDPHFHKVCETLGLNESALAVSFNSPIIKQQKSKVDVLPIIYLPLGLSHSPITEMLKYLLSVLKH